MPKRRDLTYLKRGMKDLKFELNDSEYMLVMERHAKHGPQLVFLNDAFHKVIEEPMLKVNDELAHRNGLITEELRGAISAYNAENKKLLTLMEGEKSHFVELVNILKQSHNDAMYKKFSDLFIEVSTQLVKTKNAQNELVDVLYSPDELLHFSKISKTQALRYKKEVSNVGLLTDKIKNLAATGHKIVGICSVFSDDDPRLHQLQDFIVPFSKHMNQLNSFLEGENSKFKQMNDNLKSLNIQSNFEAYARAYPEISRVVSDTEIAQLRLTSLLRSMNLWK